MRVSVVRGIAGDRRLVGVRRRRSRRTRRSPARVKDQSGAIMPGATVTRDATRDRAHAHGRHRRDNGEYRLPALPPGRYSVDRRAAAASAPRRRPDIVLVIDQTAILNFALKPAAVAETVTVTGESPIVDTTRSDVSTSVSTQQIQDLPVASRRWIDLAMLTPGTSQDNIRGQFYRGNVNIGAGAPRILERLRRRRRQQHVGRDGRAAAELRDGRDPASSRCRRRTTRRNTASRPAGC